MALDYSTSPSTNNSSTTAAPVTPASTSSSTSIPTQVNLPSSSAYCFISDKDVHCVPINSFNSFSDNFIALDNTSKQNDEADFTPDKLYLKNKNLLYSLNNPSLSDLELDSPTLSNATLHTGSPPLSLAIPTNNNLQNHHIHHSQNNQTLIPPSQTSSQTSSELNLPAIINNYSTHAIYLPRLIINLSENLNTEFKELKGLLIKIFPTWSPKDVINLKQLTGGITNMLLSCTNQDLNETVLIRVYGHGTNLIIDRHREFISHLILNSLGLAPPIFSRFKNGLVYGYLSGRSLEPNELSNENLFPLIAQNLGNWHKKLDYKLIENGVEKLRTFSMNLKLQLKSSNGGSGSGSGSGIGSLKNKKFKKKFISNVWELLEDWIDIVPINPDLISSFNDNLPHEVSQDNLKTIIQEEFSWLKENLSKSNSPVVSSHCDLLSGNVIIPQDFDLQKPLINLPSIEDNPIKFIDYEYMLPAPRAFDIANHFAEWQGFNCDRSAIPTPHKSNEILVKWVRGYLGDLNAPMNNVEELIDEIATFYGLPGFYWGIWAMIQSELSNIDFNYSNYGKLRLEEYWEWKGHYLKKQTSP
ncbi:ethanolamine kinase [Scheffersomyces amazonensis]|uniref:ethanolamine kinase n=1 Tax=Scheffersomyces amazonensis TaxID=1078765 RepID=UPI00315D7926